MSLFPKKVEYPFKSLWLDHYCSDCCVSRVLYVWQKIF